MRQPFLAQPSAAVAAWDVATKRPALVSLWLRVPEQDVSTGLEHPDDV